jgi:hypothetical protein
MSQSRKLLSAKDAREQAAEFLGFMASVTIDVGGKPFEIPNPSLLSPDQQDRYDELEFETEKLDRHPDPVNEDGTPKVGNDGHPLKGAVMIPHRVNGVRVENYETRLAKALFGEDYEAFIAAGGYPSQVGVHWAEMRRALEEREKSDAKSVGSDRELVEVPEADSSGA